MVKQYKKKPVVIQAIQYDGFHTGAINDFCGNKVREPKDVVSNTEED